MTDNRTISFRPGSDLLKRFDRARKKSGLGLTEYMKNVLEMHLELELSPEAITRLRGLATFHRTTVGDLVERLLEAYEKSSDLSK